MGNRYLDTKKDSLESSILGVWQEAAVKQEKLVGGQKKLDKDKDGDIDGFTDGLRRCAGVSYREGEGGLPGGFCCRVKDHLLELGEGDVTDFGDCREDGLAIGIVAEAADLPQGCIGQGGDGVGEGLAFLADATAWVVVQVLQANGCSILIFQEEEGAEVAAGADGFVVNGLKVELDAGQGVAAELIPDDVLEGDLTTDVWVGLEGEGAVVVVGDQAGG